MSNMFNLLERRCNLNSQAMSTIRRDFIVSNLRAQLNRMHSVLNNIENDETADCGYTNESLKGIEANLKQIRKLCCDN